MDYKQVEKYRLRKVKVTLDTGSVHEGVLRREYGFYYCEVTRGQGGNCYFNPGRIEKIERLEK